MLRLRSVLFLLVCMLITSVAGVRAESLTTCQELLCQRDNIKDVMKRVVDFQEEAFGGRIITDWKVGTFYSGVYAAYQATGDEHFYQAALKWCEAANWTLSENHFFADDICTAQTFLDVYMKDQDPKMIANVKEVLEKYFTKETVKRNELGWAVWKGDERPFIGRNVWWWCDSLYMAPPVFSRMYAATKDQRYLDLLNSFYWDTVDFLFKENDGLFARDETYFDKKTPSGKPVYWSRGNGWVYGGLIRTLDYIPESDQNKQKYIDLFVKMTDAIVKYQQPDGLWRPGINDPSWKTMKETSGTSFYCFGLLGGINRGYLDRKIYLPVALKAWQGLLECINSEGRLGYAQLVAGGPAHVRPNDFVDYTNGAFLLAASELYKMNLSKQDFVELREPYDIKFLSRDGMWTWFNDERVIYDGDGLFIGSNDSNGYSRVDYYSVVNAQSPYVYQPSILSSWSSKDDHNNPALLQIDRNTILACYSQHNLEKTWYTRTAKLGGSKAFRTVNWGKEVAIEAPALTTYNNLMKLSDENGRIYNFMRCVGWNPTVLTSDDNGQTWSEPFDFIHSGNDRTRPYVKYASNSKDRIDFIYTDAHPRQAPNNNVYHIYYSAGNFYKSDGTLIKSMEQVKTDPLVPSDGTMIYNGSTDGRGWVWDLEYAADGTPVVAFINSVDGAVGNDLRYRLATLNDGKWLQSQIAYAGTHIYDREQHYAGGIAIDPENTSHIYISCDVDPVTGIKMQGGKYQIFKGICDNGQWQYQQLTFDAQVDNLRPIVPRNHKHKDMVIWCRGRYDTYEDFDTEIVGIIEK